MRICSVGFYCNDYETGMIGNRNFKKKKSTDYINLCLDYDSFQINR